MPAPAGSGACGTPQAGGRRRRVRRSAWLFGAIAAAFYLGFIVLTLLRAL